MPQTFLNLLSGNILYGKPNQLHPDQHFFAFHPNYDGTSNQQMFIGNDGGVWRTDNARAAVSTGVRAACDPAANQVRWTALNNGYGVTQFYHGTVAPDGQSYFGGTQDNGTVRGRAGEGVNEWREILAADGGYSAIDFRNPNNIYTSTQGGGFRKSTDGGRTFSSATLGLSGTLSFITPMTMDPSDPQRLYLGGSLLFRSNRGMAAWNNLGSPQSVSLTTGVLSAVAVAPTDSNSVLVGLSDGSIVLTRRALSLGPLTPLSAAQDRAVRPRTGNVSWVAFDPNDRNVAYATYSTFGGGAHVYRTLNGGTSWSGIDGTGTDRIPDIPVHCIVIDPANTGHLYVGTDLGVFVSHDAGATWSVENTSFANTVTETLALNVANGVTSLFAFTHGRGAYRVKLNETGCQYSLAESGATAPAGGGDVSVNVTAAPAGNCNWKSESNVPWISVQPDSSGAGNGTARLRVGAFTGLGTRFGTVAIAGRSFTVAQTGAPDVDSPVIRITNPAASLINTQAGVINVTGTALDNDQVTSIAWRTDRGLAGTQAGTSPWTITGIPLLAGQNVISISATDRAGNVSNTAKLTVNSMPRELLTTVAGTGASGFNGNNITAIAAMLGRPWRISFDAGGNLYIADDVGQRIRRVTPNGIITTIAGNGTTGFSGDGGLATNASLNFPSQAVVDAQGNVYIADYSNRRIRKITAATGVISTVAGTGTAGFSGDGDLATAAQLNGPDSLAFDQSGDLYIADSLNHRVRKITLSDGKISTVAGTGTTGLTGDGGPATAANMTAPIDLAFDSAGNLYIATQGNNRIRKVARETGTITTLLGDTAALAIGGPLAVAIDANDQLYFYDTLAGAIRRLNLNTQELQTIVGGSTTGFTPDGAGALGARINGRGIALSPSGRLFFADTNNFRVRTTLPTISGDTTAPVVQITTPANTGSADATTNPLVISGTASDSNGVITVRWSNDRGGSGTTTGTTNWTIPTVTLQPGVSTITVTAWDVNGNAGSATLALTYRNEQLTVTTIAGTNTIDDTGDGSAATAATLFQPRGVAVDSKGNIYVADTQNRRVRRIAPDGTMHAFAGTGNIGSSGDGGPAVNATLNFPNVVIVDKADNVYISDELTHRVRKVTPDGTISTIAGNGVWFGTFSGDGGPAKDAGFNRPVGLAVDGNQNVFIVDFGNNRIRRIDAATGVVTTVAGTGELGFGGDGGPAKDAFFSRPTGVAVDAAGNLYIADTNNNRIRRVSASDGRITTIAGTGTAGYTGDGGAATNATLRLSYPATLTINAATNELFFADRNNHAIRKIALDTGLISTVVGTGSAGFNGDGTAPLATLLSFPTSVAFDSSGALLIADSGNNRIRRLRAANAIGRLTTVSAATFSAANGLAAEAIATIFGTNLASETKLATALPLPLTLAGTTVRVRDSLNVERVAPLFFVSAGQINYLVPTGTANGIATVTITNAAGEVATGLVTIADVAPGLFAANATGTGVATGVALRRKPGQPDRYEPIAQLDAATNQFVPVPLDLGPPDEMVYVVLYGTGIRGFNAFGSLSASVGGTNATVVYAGAAPGFVGADQVNILLLDRALAGRGKVDVVFKADGKTSNAVQLEIK